MLKELCPARNELFVPVLDSRWKNWKLTRELFVSEGSVNTVTVNVTMVVKLKNIFLYLTVTNELHTAADNAFSATELNKTSFAFGIFNFIILPLQKNLLIYCNFGIS